MRYRIHLTGASCSGVTTLGKALATNLALPFVDTDDHYWAPVDPPFSVKRAPEARLASMKENLGRGDWVLSGSCGMWGKEITDQADLIVFLYTPTDIRMKRLRTREAARFGDRIKPGGDMNRIHEAFAAWAQSYDDPSFDGRSLAGHEYWLSRQTAPVLRLDGTYSVERLALEVTDSIFSRRQAVA